MLLLLRNYTLAPAFRLKPSVLSVATRQFLTSIPNHSPSQAQKTGDDKPKRYLKKDLTPPKKRPMTGFVAFVLERAKKIKGTSTTPVPYVDILRECSAAWKKLSDKEKASYSPPAGAYKEYKDYIRKWHEGLSDEAKKALKLRRRRRTSTGFSLFTSETYANADGDTIGKKISNRAAAWKLLSAEKKEEYRKRAKETLFGVRALRAAQRERELARVAKRKEVEKAKKIADRAKAVAKAKAEKLKAEKLRAQQSKAQQLKEEKKKAKALDKGKKKEVTKAKPKTTPTPKAKAKAKA